MVVVVVVVLWVHNPEPFSSVFLQHGQRLLLQIRGLIREDIHLILVQAFRVNPACHQKVDGHLFSAFCLAFW